MYVSGCDCGCYILHCRIRNIEEDKHNEVQKLSSEISNLKSSIKSYENQLSEKDSEL